MNRHGFFSGLLIAACCSGPVLAADRPVPISVAKVAMAAVYDEVPLTGTVTARRVARISPKIDGFVQKMHVDEGDEVNTGDALLELDPVMADIALRRVQAQVREAQAVFDEAIRQRDEAAELVDKKHISATSFESREADVMIRSAALQRLQAELSQQQEVLRRHTIYAPFDGVVASKEIEIGQWVESSTSLIELVEISVLRIDVPVPQLYFSRVVRGTPVTIKLDALPQRSFDAEVTMKIPSGDPTTRTFPVRIEIENRERIIAPGMSARVRVKLQEEKEAMLVPRDAIVRKPDGSESVWLVIGAGTGSIVESKPVESGRSYRDNVEVYATDLRVGDRVVVRGNEILQENQSVNVVTEMELNL